MNYIHISPVNHGYVEKLRNWPYSTFHRYVELGVYPEDWSSEPTLELDASEPRYGE